MLESVDLRKAWLFEELTPAEAERLSGVVECRTCPAETVLVAAGTFDRQLYVVYSGSVRIVTTDAAGNESPIAEVLPGQHFGEISFIDGGTRTATAVTNEATELLVIESARFRALAGPDPAVAYKVLWSMLRLLCGRLRNTDHWLFELMRRGDCLAQELGTMSRSR